MDAECIILVWLSLQNILTKVTTLSFGGFSHIGLSIYVFFMGHFYRFGNLEDGSCNILRLY